MQQVKSRRKPALFCPGVLGDKKRDGIKPSLFTLMPGWLSAFVLAQIGNAWNVNLASFNDNQTKL